MIFLTHVQMVQYYENEMLSVAAADPESSAISSLLTRLGAFKRGFSCIKKGTGEAFSYCAILSLCVCMCRTVCQTIYLPTNLSIISPSLYIVSHVCLVFQAFICFARHRTA